MVTIREVGPGDWETMRDVRLAALREDPYAFGATYASEAAFTEEQWRGRIHDRGVTYLAYLDRDAPPAGIAGVYEPSALSAGGPSAPSGPSAGGPSGQDGSGRESVTPEVVSMWVRPSARGRNVGDALMGVCVGWARARGHDGLHLWVTESNMPARKLYERYGFAPTGETQALPSDPSLPEIGMRLAL